MSFSESQCSKRKRAEGAKRFENSGRVNQEGAGQEISYQRNRDQRQRSRAKAEYKAPHVLPGICRAGARRQVTAQEQLRPEAKGGSLREKKKLFFQRIKGGQRP